MFSFCPHCGGSIDQEQRPGQTVMCVHCHQTIGTVATPAVPRAVDRSEELVKQGIAARCPHCEQLVELKGKAFAPHFQAGVRKMCPQSGKPVTAEAPPLTAAPKAGKDLSAFMTRDTIRLVSCQRRGQPQVEELKLEYLDKKDRIRLQIDALREILGPGFRMRPYPQALGRPEFTVWNTADACIVGKTHEHGGYQSLDETQVLAVTDDFRNKPELFFAG